MKAGRDLDALIAEKIFDHIIRGYEDENVKIPLVIRKRLSLEVVSDPTKLKDLEADQPLPPYSTDARSALQVVEEMRRRGYRGMYEGVPNSCTCTFADGNVTHVETAETVPLAICKCALRALGYVPGM